MFLLVSGRPVGAHPDGHQHGVSLQIYINLGKMFLRISCIRKIIVTWILARTFAYLPSFFSQILDLIYWTVLIFILNGVTLKTSNILFSVLWRIQSENVIVRLFFLWIKAMGFLSIAYVDIFYRAWKKWVIYQLENFRSYVRSEERKRQLLGQKKTAIFLSLLINEKKTNPI